MGADIWIHLQFVVIKSNSFIPKVPLIGIRYDIKTSCLFVMGTFHWIVVHLGVQLLSTWYRYDGRSAPRHSSAEDIPTGMHTAHIDTAQ